MKHGNWLVAAGVAAVIGSVGTANAASGPSIDQYRALKHRVAAIEQRVDVIENGPAPTPVPGTTQTLTMYRHNGTMYTEWNNQTNTGVEPIIQDSWLSFDPKKSTWEGMISETVTPIEFVIK
jgi:hypothetical protein